MSKISAYPAATGALGPTDVTIVNQGGTTKKVTMDILSGVLAQSGAAVTHTGDIVEFTLATVSVPAGSMGANGMLEINVLFSKVGTAGSATYRVKFGGTAFHVVSPSATTLGYEARIRISNQNATNAQVGVSTGVTGGIGTAAGANTTGSIDTTSAQNITITAQNGNSADTVGVASYQVILHPKA